MLRCDISIRSGRMFGTHLCIVSECFHPILICLVSPYCERHTVHDQVDLSRRGIVRLCSKGLVSVKGGGRQ